MMREHFEKTRVQEKPDRIADKLWSREYKALTSENVHAMKSHLKIQN